MPRSCCRPAEHGPVRLPDPPAADLQGALEEIAAALGGPVTERSVHVRVSQAGGVLRLHLDKPAKRNALDDDMVELLIDGIDAAGRDESVRAVLLDGRGRPLLQRLRHRRPQRRQPRRRPEAAHRLDPAAPPVAERTG